MATNITVGTQPYSPTSENGLEEPTAEPDQNGASASTSTTAATPAAVARRSDGSSGNASDGHSPDEVPTPPSAETTSRPSFARYGIGDTVILGRPNFASPRRVAGNDQSDAARTSASTSTPSNAALATTPPSPTTPAAPSIASAAQAAPAGGETPSESKPQEVSRREPYLTPGLHTTAEQSPHYTNANEYGQAHGYSSEETMKLAVLMQNNGDKNMGREWLSLRPEVLRAAVNSVVRHADNSFDTSAAFGGTRGYYDAGMATQRTNINAEGLALNAEGGTIGTEPFVPPSGWVLDHETTGGGDAGTQTVAFYRPGDDMLTNRDTPYLPLMVAGYMQVPHGMESELSVGAPGGVIDLTKLDFDPEYGLITRSDNYRPYVTEDNDLDRAIQTALVVVVSAGAMAIVGPAVSAAFGTSTTGVVLAGAANGVIGSAITTTLQDGDITFKGLFQAALTGGLMAGLDRVDGYRGLRDMGLNGDGTVNYGLRALSITGTSTIRGAIQELVGGRFRDGFTQGVVQGLSAEITRFLDGDIAGRLARNEITPTQARALNELSRFTGSALRAAANPNDPMYAFAQDYLGQLLGPGGANGSGADGTGTRVTGTVFDDDGNLMPGMVDTKAPLNTQREQIVTALTLRGSSAADAQRMADGWVIERIADLEIAQDRTLSRDAARTRARQVLYETGGGLEVNVTVSSNRTVTGSEVGDQIFGALTGTATVGIDLLNGVIDLAAMSRDGYAALLNIITDDAFPDATARNTSREDTLNRVMANIDKLPAAIVDGFNAELEHANELDRSNNPADHIEAARLRSHAFGGAVLAVLTLGETTVAAAGGVIRTISNLAEARVALGEILEVTHVGLRAQQSGAIDIAAMFEGGRVLVRNGTDFFIAEFRAVGQAGARQLVLLRPVTELIDDAMRMQLRYAPESMAPENIARINRAIDALTPQRFQQLTERYAQLVNSDRRWKWETDIGPGITDTQQLAIRRAAIEGGLIPDVPYLAGTRYANFNAVPGLVRNVESLPSNMWRLGDTQQFAYLDALIGGRPPGYTWHHSQVPGRMELVPFGVHNIFGHFGGRSPGHWAAGPR
jgi:A nuclease of the HNH/ENDO VII superfamily with conserved WHH